MKIIPLAADSLGVRSMATYVEAGATGLLIDPGATLAAARYGLPPSQEEWDALKRANDRISAYAARARYVFISHYHDDHFRSDPASYAGRVVLAKDPRRMVSGAQARRANALWSALVIQQRPTTLYLSGPPSYLEREVGTAAIDRSVANLRRILDATDCRVIMDHYALRDPRFSLRFERLWE